MVKSKPRFRLYSSRALDYQYGFQVTPAFEAAIKITGWGVYPCDFFIRRGECIKCPRFENSKTIRS